MQTILEYNSQLESYRYAFYFCLIVGLVFALLAIVLCVAFKVDVLVGELSGSMKRKTIKRHNGADVNVRPRNAHRQTFRNTDQLIDMSQLSCELPSTEEIDTGQMDTLPLSKDDETVILSKADMADEQTLYETVVLSNNPVAHLEEDIVVSSTSRYL